MEYTQTAGAEPLPGYRLIEPLGMGGFGEVWKCEVPGGLFKAIKFVHGNLEGLDPENTAQQEFQALERVKAIRHPFVLSLERVEVLQGELVMVMELADKNMEDRLRECQAEGLPGIPREELLQLLHDASEALDLLNVEHNLQHLDIKPSNLFIVGNHVKLADFGLVQSLEELSASDNGGSKIGMTPLYSPPEMLQGKGSKHCDQYSLGIVYQQLLTGSLPFDGKNARQLMMQHMAAEPNLKPLDEADRPLVARALAKKPEDRFDCCLDFIRALVLGSQLVDRPQTGSQKRSSSFIRLPPKNAIEARAREHESPSSNKANRHSDRTPRWRMPADRQLAAPSSSQHTTPVGQTTPASRSMSQNNRPAGGERPQRPAAPPEPPSIPGYEVLDCLQTGPLGELWKIRSSAGDQLLARVLPDVEGSAEAVKALSQKLEEVQHSSLPKQRLLDVSDKQLIVMDYGQPTLQDRFESCVSDGQLGVPRKELLKYIAKTARALDELAEKLTTPHGNLGPHGLMMDGDKIIFTDFGLVKVLRPILAAHLGDINPRYTAPECLGGEITPRSDQYSLALIFAEMLSGFHPRPKATVRGGGKASLDLTFLSSDEQDVVRKALDDDPSKRFASCMEFVEALGVRYKSSREDRTLANLTPLIWLSEITNGKPPKDRTLPSAGEYFRTFFSRKAKIKKVHTTRHGCFIQHKDGTLESEASIRIPEGILPQKLADMAKRLDAKLENPQRREYQLLLRQKSSMWGRFVGNPGGIEIRLAFSQSTRSPNILAGLKIRIQTYGKDCETIQSQLLTQGPQIMQTVCETLQVDREKRELARVAYTRKILAYPISAEKHVGEPIEAIGKDLSTSGLGMILPRVPPTRQLYLQLEQSPDPILVLVNVIHNCPTEDGRFEIGLTLAEIKSAAACAH